MSRSREHCDFQLARRARMAETCLIVGGEASILLALDAKDRDAAGGIGVDAPAVEFRQRGGAQAGAAS